MFRLHDHIDGGRVDRGGVVRDDDHFANVAVYEYQGADAEPARHTEQLYFNAIHPKKRSYR